MTLIICAFAAAFALFYNLFTSPDSLYDEVVYTRAAQNVALHGQLTWTNRPLFVHPPLFFLLQAGWLLLTGSAHGSLIAAIRSARLLNAAIGAFDVVLIAGFAWRLSVHAGIRRRRILTASVAIVAALDPVLLRYSRQDVIEPLALMMTLVTLHLAWSYRQHLAQYVAWVGLATGFALLTNEITIFALCTPLVFALLRRDRSLTKASFAALLLGVAICGTLLLWAVELGLTASFVNVQTVTFQRLVGLVQSSGLHVAGVSLLKELHRSFTEYASTYLVLVIGGLALCWSWLRRGSEVAAFLTAWLTASYAFAAYIVAAGTLNEQFFVYILPAAIVGAVLFIDAIVAVTMDWRLTRKSNWWGRHAQIVGVFLTVVVSLGVLVPSGVAWVSDYHGPSDAVLRMDQYLAAHRPSCTVVNASGDVEKYSYLLPGRPFSFYTIGPAAVADGVHDFILSPGDAAAGYGNMSPAFAQWIRANGREIVSFSSKTYESIQLWAVKTSAYNAFADTIDVPGGIFVNTVGSHCGGYPVINNATDSLLGAYANRGGKALLGPPRSNAFVTATGSVRQLFDGALLTAGNGGGIVPVVAEIAMSDTSQYNASGLPRVSMSPPDPKGRSAWLTDPSIRREYLGSNEITAGTLAEGARRFGLPLAPPTTRNGVVEQPFAGVVLEHLVGHTGVSAANIAPLLLSSHAVTIPPATLRPVPDPTLANPIALPSPQPTTVIPFVATFGGLVALYVLSAMLILRRRKRTPA